MTVVASRIPESCPPAAVYVTTVRARRDLELFAAVTTNFASPASPPRAIGNRDSAVTTWTRHFSKLVGRRSPMTDQQRLLVALLSENDDVMKAEGAISPLELMAILSGSGDPRSALTPTLRGER
jgi:hypothetical protein